MVHGYSGNAGNGGRGGDAGRGGDGGDDEHGGGILGWGEGPEEGDGGAPGNAGKGGDAGTYIESIIKYNVPGINETVSANPGAKEATSGGSGYGNDRDSAGDKGFK